MHKSSVYLPPPLKQALNELAAKTGRSEADLIRHAIEALVAGADRGDRPGDVEGLVDTARPSLVGIGVGPGDVGAVTLRARATLLAADRVLVITTDARSVGRAEMVVRAVAPTASVQRVPFAIGADPEGRRVSFARLVDVVVAALDARELVAVAVIGDPSQWTIFPELAAAVARSRPGVTITAEPGITSYQVAAAGALATLGHSGGALVVLDDAAHLDQHLSHPDRAVVLYKGTTDGAAVKAAAAHHTRPDAVVAELSGLPGQRLVALADAEDGPISYLATVVFPPRGMVTAEASR